MIELTNAFVRTKRGLNHSEYIPKRTIKIGAICLATEELILALDINQSLNDLQKRLLGETNGHLIKLRAIKRVRQDKSDGTHFG